MAKDENGSWHVMISNEKGLKTSDPNGYERTLYLIFVGEIECNV